MPYLSLAPRTISDGGQQTQPLMAPAELTPLLGKKSQAFSFCTVLSASASGLAQASGAACEPPHFFPLCMGVWCLHPHLHLTCTCTRFCGCTYVTQCVCGYLTDSLTRPCTVLTLSWRHLASSWWPTCGMTVSCPATAAAAPDVASYNEAIWCVACTFAAHPT